MNATWIKVLLLGMLALALAGGGWLVRGWKDGSDAKNDIQAKADAAAQQYLVLNQSNQLTAQGMAALLTSLEGQAHAFGQLDAFLAAHPMGACTFDPATDQLWSGAYQAAFAHQAGGSTGGARAAGPAARQHQPAHR